MAARVLVVDDDQDVVKLIRMTLEAEGFEVTSAANGADCLSAVGSQQPDLIILDIAMPILDGFQTLHLLRDNTETASIPVIMLTASKRDADVVTGWASGVDFYLTKPFDIRDLVTATKRMLEVRSAEVTTKLSENRA